MVSQRQRLARKQFKEANPHLFPKPEPQPSNASDSKKIKKKKKLKKSKGDAKAARNSIRFSKHPFRVPGMRPGESCFICKSREHIAKLCPEKAQWERNKICLFCRKRGHSVKNCSEKGDDESDNKKFCYNCGETGHTLSKCLKPLQDGGSKFASCFICKQTGHLSKNCPKNEHGIYPKGGCCKVCGEVSHLARYCPNKGNGNGNGDFANSFDQNTVMPEVTQQNDPTCRRGGDDLEDDFIVQVEAKNVKTSDLSNSKSKSKSGVVAKEDNNNDFKSKKAKQGPKVVNFLG